jgi:hypothetical protein
VSGVWRRALVAIAVCGAISAPPWAAAREIWVDANAAGAAGPLRGTSDAPLRTIAAAAKVAVAGDVVTIRAGEYPEQTIAIPNSGTAGNPVVFQAERPGTVRIIGGPEVKEFTNDERPILFGTRPRRKDNNELWSGAQHVTLRGLTIANARGVAIAAGTGWRIEDCLITWPMFDGIVARGDDITVLRTVVENAGNNGMTGGFGRNIRIADSITRRCNRIGNAPGNTSGASKFLWTTGLRVHRHVSYDNFGSGWWMDWNNVDYEVAGSTIFGNHAGEAMEHGERVDQWWAGAGIWSEGNPGPGRIADNLIYSNTGAGIGLLESGRVTVEHNVIFDCARGIELRDMDREDVADHERQRAVRDLVIRDNRFKAWRDDAAIATSIGAWAKGPRPRDYRVAFRNNLFDPIAGSGILMWIEAEPFPQPEAMAMLEESGGAGSEAAGAGNRVTRLPAPAKTIGTVSTNLAAITAALPQRFRQVESDAVEKLSIRDAFAGRAIGEVIAIPALGRTAFEAATGGKWSCEVYDLATRAHVRLHLRSEADRDALGRAVGVHASLEPAWVRVRVTRNDPYHLEAEYISLQAVADH